MWRLRRFLSNWLSCTTGQASSSGCLLRVLTKHVAHRHLINTGYFLSIFGVRIVVGAFSYLVDQSVDISLAKLVGEGYDAL